MIRHLDAGRKRWGYLLLVDEVQTGMYRTGPFTFVADPRTHARPVAPRQGDFGHDVPVRPDALLRRGQRTCSNVSGNGITDSSRNATTTTTGFRTVVNVLRLAEESRTCHQVADAGALFDRLLQEGLASTPLVRQVARLGLLIGIELEQPGAGRVAGFASAFLVIPFYHASAMRFPRVRGLLPVRTQCSQDHATARCDPDEIRQACTTIIDVLRRPLFTVLARLLGGLIIRRLLRENAMSMQTTQPLSLLHVDFDDLYAGTLAVIPRFGINVGHLVALYGLGLAFTPPYIRGCLSFGVPSGWLIVVAFAADLLRHCRL